VIATSSDDEKLARARTLGAELGINYRTTPQWGKAVRAHSRTGAGPITSSRSAAPARSAESLAAVRPGGRISVIGVLSGRQAPIDVAAILMRNVTLQGIFVGSRAHFEGLARAVELGADARGRPYLRLRGAPRALAHLETGRHFGKIALRKGDS
jgi:NADPH:quinone reductase-like Zn-dependent oxidoreductase